MGKTFLRLFSYSSDSLTLPFQSSLNASCCFNASTSYNFLRCVTGRTLWKLSEIRNVYKTIIDILKVKFVSLEFPFFFFIIQYLHWMFFLSFPVRYQFWVSFRVPNQTYVSSAFNTYLECLKRLDFHEVFWCRENITLDELFFFSLPFFFWCQRCVW